MDTFATSGGNAANASEIEAEGAPETAPENLEDDVSLEEGARKDEKPWSRAEQRIRKLVREKKEAVASSQEARATISALQSEIAGIKSKLDTVVSKDTTRKGTFDDFSTDDLYGLKTKYLNKDSEDFSPAMIAKIDQEIIGRVKKEVETGVRASVERETKAKMENARVFNETVQMLGEAGADLANPQSPLYRLANQRYAEMIQSYGKESVEQDPSKQQLAILKAYHELQSKSGEAFLRARDQQRGKIQARDQMAAQSEAAVADTNEIQSLLKKRDVKGALAKSPLIRAVAEGIESMRARR